ncbi:MAG: ABC transporter transmembrane domain-containing protein [Fibrobacterales bacterium]
MKGFEQDILVNESALSQCLLPFLDALGWVGKEKTILEARPHLVSDFDVIGFLNTMANLGYETHVLKRQLDNLSDQLFPLIHIESKGKPRVILRRENNGILVYDGEEESYEVVPYIDGGLFLLVHKTSGLHRKVFEPQKNWFYHVGMRFKSIGFVVLFLSFLLVLLAFCIPIIVMGVYDVLLTGDSVDSPILLGVGIAIFILSEAAIRLLRYFIMNYAGSRLGNIVNNQVMRRILYLPPSYTETSSVGSQVSRIRDFGTVKEFIEGNGSIAIIEAPFYMLLIVALVLLAGNLAYIPAIIACLFILIGVVLSPFVKQINEESSSNSIAKQEYTIDLINNFHDIKQVGEHGLWKKRFRDFSAEASFSNYKTAQINGIITNLSQMLITIAGALTVGFGAYKVMNNTLTPGALVAALIIVWRILGPVKAAFSVGTQSTRLRRSITQLNRLMSIKIEKNVQQEAVLSRSLRGSIFFNNVSFRYNNEAHPALLGVNLAIKKGECMAFTGHDGSGKSSIFKLILGMYKPQSGRVLIDSFNVQQLDPIQVRHSIGYSPKNDTMFYGTIEQNLKLVTPEATEDDMIEAAKLSGLWSAMEQDTITFGTRVGDNLSHGVRPSYNKLINLTRMFLKKSPILLLDEPEQLLQNDEVEFLAQNIAKLRGVKTILLITKNPILLKVAQSVTEFERGRVVSNSVNKQE